MTYEQWIINYRTDFAKHCLDCLDSGTTLCPHLAGFCHGAADAMSAAFPELRLTRGYVYDIQFGDGHPHWWCCTADGKIVDPTACQFEFLPDLGRYEEYSEEKHGPLPSGKCPNCGSFFYQNDFGGMCSAECHDDYVDYINEELNNSYDEGRTGSGEFQSEDSGWDEGDGVVDGERGSGRDW